MTDLIDEVANDLQEEKYNSIIKKTVRVFLICSALVIISVSFYAWQDSTTKKLQYQLGDWMAKALFAIESEKLDDALPFLDKIIAFPHQQYAALAYLQKSSIFIKKGQTEDAQTLLLEMMKHKHFNQNLRELAEIIYLSNQLKIGKNDGDTMDKINMLIKNDKTWLLSALEIKALHEVKEKNYSQAKLTLNEILSSKKINQYSKDIASSILSSIYRTE